MQVKKAGTRPTAQVLVRSADGEVRVERRDVERIDAERVIRVEQDASARRVRSPDDVRQVGDPLARIEDHLRDHDQVRARPDGRLDVRGREETVGARLDERKRDAPAARVFAQDHVERIELATRGHDTRRRIVRVEDRAQALCRAGLGHDAVRARRAEEPREPPAIGVHLRLPRVPRAAQLRVPRGQRFAHVVLGRIERAAKRMIREIDAVAPCAAHVGEQRRDVARERVVRQRTRTECGDGRLDPLDGGLRCVHARSGGDLPPMTVRTSISSGKNALSSARLR